MSLPLIRKQYGVPAFKLGRVTYTGGLEPSDGRILSATKTGSLRIMLDGGSKAVAVHPTEHLSYHDDPAHESLVTSKAKLVLLPAGTVFDDAHGFTGKVRTAEGVQYIGMSGHREFDTVPLPVNIIRLGAAA